MNREAPKLSAMNQISMEDLHSHVDDDDVLVIDVRNNDEVERSGHIHAKHWINIPLSEFEAALDLSEAEFKTKYQIDKMTPDGSGVMIHCELGGRGTKATLMALEHGYDKCKHLEGGHRVWRQTFPDA